jgi:hypothetical protein
MHCQCRVDAQAVRTATWCIRFRVWNAIATRERCSDHGVHAPPRES